MITRTYYLEKDRIFICVIDCDSHSGSIQYDFKTGELTANKPDMMLPLLWLKFVRHFLNICKQMVIPMVKEDD